VLAGYVSVESVRDLIGGDEAAGSIGALGGRL
jgi:hypothetical protein